MIYLLDANVFMNLANRAEGYERIRDKLKGLNVGCLHENWRRPDAI